MSFEKNQQAGIFLDPPSYSYWKDGKFYLPSSNEIFREFFMRLNVFKTRKNWLALFNWTTTLSFAIPLAVFFSFYFSWGLFALGLIYSMVFLGSHGTFWLHRYSSHRAFTFKNRFIRDICKNLVIKIIPEETYVVSHHVHHRISEEAGDPYNVHGGWLYCFLADVNHQKIAQNLSREQYAKLTALLKHTGIRMNSYEAYQKWGSVCHPLTTSLHFLLNWSAWYAIFFLIGGHALALALFGMSGVWAIGVRTFNYDGHGRGKNLQKEGTDFHKKDLSINQIWPGYVAGEWHNNHHLYPSSAKTGFLSYQLDLPWLMIRSLAFLGAISSFKDNHQDFLRDHYYPYLAHQEENAILSTGE